MEETNLIAQYNAKQKELELAEEEMNNHFEKITDDMLLHASQPEDFVAIKERLRSMPECASKVLLFRKIILTEDNLKRIRRNVN